MNKFMALLVALVVTVFTASALAFNAPPAPAKGFYVYDGTGQMTATQISALNHKIDRISKATNNEFGIAFLQSLDGTPIEDASYATFRAWGVGKHGLDNGVLIMLSLKDHKSRIETGKGVGGELTDIQAKQILDGMRPALKSGDFYGAFNFALDKCSVLLDSRAGQKATNAPTVNPTQVQQQAADRIAQQSPQTSASNPAVQQSQPSSGGSHTGLIVALILIVLGAAGVGFYFLVVVPKQEAEFLRKRNAERLDYERRQREANEKAEAAMAADREEEARKAAAAKAAARQAALDWTPPAPSAYVPPYVHRGPAVGHTHHTTTSHVQSRPSVPLMPKPQPAVCTPIVRPAVPVEDNSAAIAVAAAAALVAEQEEERRAERRRQEREDDERRAEARRLQEEAEEERRAEARQREREEEERRAEARRQEEEDRRQREEDDRRRRDEESSSSSSSSFDTGWGGGSDSGGGDSSGGGASSDW